jgi:hypothetical protein
MVALLVLVGARGMLGIRDCSHKLSVRRPH